MCTAVCPQLFALNCLPSTNKTVMMDPDPAEGKGGLGLRSGPLNDGEWTFLALVGLQDPARDTAKEAVADLHAALSARHGPVAPGMPPRVIIISGVYCLPSGVCPQVSAVN